MAAEGTTKRSPRTLNLLIVDDDPAIVRLVSSFLKSDMPDDIEIHKTSSPTEARDWLDQHSCDILLSDIEMPGLTGLDMLRFAKQRNAWTQVIFMTAHSTWDHISEAIENGACDYLLKPIDRDDLSGVVSDVRSRMIRWQSALQGTFRSMAKA